MVLENQVPASATPALRRAPRKLVQSLRPLLFSLYTLIQTAQYSTTEHGPVESCHHKSTEKNLSTQIRKLQNIRRTPLNSTALHSPLSQQIVFPAG